MKTRFLIAASLLALAGCGGKDDGNSTAGGGLFGGSVALQPGEWEMKMELLDIKGPGIPPNAVAQMKQQSARTTRDCMTPEEAKGPNADMFTKGQAGNCKQDNFTWSGGKISGVLTCAGAGPGGQGKMTMTMDGQYGGQNIDMTMKTKTESAAGAMDMEMRISGRRIGECPAGKAG